MRKFIVAFILATVFSVPVYAELTKDDLQEIRDIIREELAHVDKRFEQVDKRFEQIDKRFQELRDGMDFRFEQVDNRFSDIMGFMWMLASIFTALVVLVMGFAIWDRRTMVRPFEKKVEEIENKIREIDDVKLKNLISTFRELAKADKKVADALKSFNLL